MPLLDHFAPGADFQLQCWESFHSTWANSIRDALHRQLPKRFLALVHVHLGRQVEADVAEFENVAISQSDNVNGDAGEGGVATQTWAPPVARLLMPALFPDDIEVQVYDQRGGAHLVAVIELVSPANKDRPESRRAFAAKCAAYLQRGIGLIVGDIVTERRFNLHNETVVLMGLEETFAMPDDAGVYAVAYRPTHRDDANYIETWPEPLVIGERLPVLPLALRGSMTIPLDLEATYTDARQRSRL
jgi:hypothetical protein